MAYFEGFQAVEAMQAASEAAGWECEYRQVEAGELEAQTVFQPLGRSSLVCETANRRLDIAARTPSSAFTVLVPLPGTRVLINGRRLTDDRLMILAPDMDFHAVSDSGAEVWSIHLDSDCTDDLEGIGNIPTRVIEGCDSNIKSFRDAIKQSLAVEHNAIAAHCEAEFANLAGRVLAGERIDGGSDLYHRRQKRQILSRAVELIESNLNRPILISHICKYAGVSRSTLERLFRREFHDTPSGYVKARRLSAVRRALKQGLRDDETIADVAAEYGFTHMGRFASAYREHFGLLPSEDTHQYQN